MYTNVYFRTSIINSTEAGRLLRGSNYGAASLADSCMSQVPTTHPPLSPHLMHPPPHNIMCMQLLPSSILLTYS